MLSEKDIVPGRHYLCRLPKLDGELSVLVAGPKLGWRGDELSSAFVTMGVWHGCIRDGVEVLCELDLEALARCDDKQRAADLRAMLDQVQSSYCATLASLECAKEHARQALDSWQDDRGPGESTDVLVWALEAIVDGDPLGPVGDTSAAVGECPECGSNLAFGLSVEPGSETTARCTRGTYLETPQKDLCGYECTLRREPDGSITVVAPEASPDESALVDEIAEGVERALGGRDG